MSHHGVWQGVVTHGDVGHTVDGDSNALGQFIAICSDKRGDSPELVDLEVIGGQAL